MPHSLSEGGGGGVHSLNESVDLMEESDEFRCVNLYLEVTSWTSTV